MIAFFDFLIVDMPFSRTNGLLMMLRMLRAFGF